MACLEEESSNRLFETLEEWNTYLERHLPHFRGPQPSARKIQITKGFLLIPGKLWMVNLLYKARPQAQDNHRAFSLRLAPEERAWLDRKGRCLALGGLYSGTLAG